MIRNMLLSSLEYFRLERIANKAHLVFEQDLSFG